MASQAPDRPERRVVHLDAIAGTRARSVPARAGTRPATARSRSLPRTRDGWLCLAERTLGHWAATLHAAFLMLAAITAFVVLIGVLFGFGGVALGALLGVMVWPVAGRPSR